ncbi:MAG: hypothetical protein FWD39_03415 [Clostridiales bacterium]|nr:hypothetical protein [Clostridiales bacterium]
MMQKKALSKSRVMWSVFFSVVLLLLFAVAFDAKPAQAAIGGDGTQGNPYTIGSAEDLALFAS